MKPEFVETEFVQPKTNMLQGCWDLSALQMSTVLRGILPLLRSVEFSHKYELKKQPEQLDLVITRYIK